MFGEPAARSARPTRAAGPRPVWPWLAPATSLVLLLFTVNLWAPRGGKPGYLVGAVGASNMLASLSLDSYVKGVHDQENVWVCATLDRAGTGFALSNAVSFPATRTNLRF